MCSERARLPPGINARPLVAADIPAALRLSEEAGWNQGRGRLAAVLAAGQGIGATDGDMLVATALTLPYGDPGSGSASPFGWISMVLVTAAWRRRGLATWLLNRCIRVFRADGRTAVLDATPAGREVSLRLGFRDGPRLMRFEGGRPAVTGTAPAGVEIRSFHPEDMATAAELDVRVFGGNRRAVLADLARSQFSAAWVAWQDGRLATQISPLVATAPALAIALFARASTGATQAHLFVDAFADQSDFTAHLTALGFRPQRPFTRMSLGGAAPGRHDLLFAAAGPNWAEPRAHRHFGFAKSARGSAGYCALVRE